MQSQVVGSRKVASGHTVMAIALCAGALYSSDAHAQLAIGPIRIDVSRKSTSRVSATSASRVLPTAERYLGVPYRWGGTSPKTGFDCSGFVQYVFAKHGTQLPRTSRGQAASGTRLRPVWSALRPGDLVMFAEPGRRISHVAIYAGRRRIIHATGSGRKVRFDALDTKRGKWYARRLVAARRVSLRGAALVRDLLTLQSSAAVSSLELDPPDHAPAPH
jgi:cell wall-associated NlpC family hydrolase